MKTEQAIYKTELTSVDEFSGKTVTIEGWGHTKGIGLFNSYAGALADYMGMWEEYCGYFRNKKVIGAK